LCFLRPKHVHVPGTFLLTNGHNVPEDALTCLECCTLPKSANMFANVSSYQPNTSEANEPNPLITSTVAPVTAPGRPAYVHPMLVYFIPAFSMGFCSILPDAYCAANAEPYVPYRRCRTHASSSGRCSGFHRGGRECGRSLKHRSGINREPATRQEESTHPLPTPAGSLHTATTRHPAPTGIALCYRVTVGLKIRHRGVVRRLIVQRLVVRYPVASNPPPCATPDTVAARAHRSAPDAAYQRLILQRVIPLLLRVRNPYSSMGIQRASLLLIGRWQSRSTPSADCISANMRSIRPCVRAIGLLAS